MVRQDLHDHDESLDVSVAMYHAGCYLSPQATQWEEVQSTPFSTAGPLTVNVQVRSEKVRISTCFSGLQNGKFA
jgi:hypothetical protein